MDLEQKGMNLSTESCGRYKVKIHLSETFFPLATFLKLRIYGDSVFTEGVLGIFFFAYIVYALLWDIDIYIDIYIEYSKTNITSKNTAGEPNTLE